LGQIPRSRPICTPGSTTAGAPQAWPGRLRDLPDPFRLTENSVQRQITGHPLATAAGMTEVGEWLITA
jgi:hypothetical protein